MERPWVNTLQGTHFEDIHCGTPFGGTTTWQSTGQTPWWKAFRGPLLGDLIRGRPLGTPWEISKWGKPLAGIPLGEHLEELKLPDPNWGTPFWNPLGNPPGGPNLVEHWVTHPGVPPGLDKLWDFPWGAYLCGPTLEDPPWEPTWDIPHMGPSIGETPWGNPPVGPSCGKSPGGATWGIPFERPTLGDPQAEPACGTPPPGQYLEDHHWGIPA